MSGSATEPDGRSEVIDKDESESKDERLVKHLERTVDGRSFWRSKNIGEEIGLSSKEVGSRLKRMMEGEIECDALEIKKWGRAKSTTWLIEPASAEEPDSRDGESAAGSEEGVDNGRV